MPLRISFLSADENRQNRGLFSGENWRTGGLPSQLNSVGCSERNPATRPGYLAAPRAMYAYKNPRIFSENDVRSAPLKWASRKGTQQPSSFTWLPPGHYRHTKLNPS